MSEPLPPSPQYQLEQPPMQAVELLVISYQALSLVEQGEALARMQTLRLRQEAGEQSETERMLASLQRVIEVAGCAPEDLTSEHYRGVIQREAKDGGPGIEPISRVIRHFGSWRLAKEAVALSETNTARRIEARFANRRLGRVWKYTEETLRETVQQCADDLGHLPQLGEFKWWRQREVELARAQGQSAYHLPGAGPYRRRYGSWENTLLHFGYSVKEVAARLERQ